MGQSAESAYLARRDFSALDNAFSTAGAALPPSESVITDSNRSGPRSAVTDISRSGDQRKLQQQGSIKYARSLYLAGLRGMLTEMRGVRPPGTPYGHTQQLTARLKPGQARSKVGVGVYQGVIRSPLGRESEFRWTCDGTTFRQAVS